MNSKNNQIQDIDRYKYLKSFVSGGIAGACAKTAIAPFERIKYIFITRNRIFNYQLAIQETKYLIKNYGVLNLWRGNLVGLIRILPFSSLNFSVFDFLKNNVYQNYSTNNKIKKQLSLFFCGAISGMISQSVCYPLEFLRTRLAMQKDGFVYRNLFHAIKLIYQVEGIQGFYSGMSLAMIGVLFYHGSGFYIVTNLKQYAKENFNHVSKKWYIDFIFGAFGAIISQLIAYPFDVIRKKKQAQGLLKKAGEQAHIMTYKEILYTCIKKEGIILTFYKGITINLIKAPIASGTAWSIKNYLNRILDKKYDF